MRGIITRTLETKAIYDNMAEDMRPYFFKDGGRSEIGWYTYPNRERFQVTLDDRGDWFILYGQDPENGCELVFGPDEKTGEAVPYEYTVWNHWDQKTYHRVFREF